MMVVRHLYLPLRCAVLWGAVAAALLLGGFAGAQEAKEQPQERAGLDTADLAQRQPELLEKALAGLPGSRFYDPPQLFFLGFAGYGGQAVFKREALAVRALFDARFQTKGRSLVLVNH